MSTAKKVFLLLGDTIVLYAALFATLVIRYGPSSFGPRLDSHLVPFSLAFVGWLLVFFLVDLYSPRTLRTRRTLFNTLLVSVVISFGLSILLFYLFGGFFRLTPKTNLIIFSVVFFVLEYGWRVIMQHLTSRERMRVAFFGDSPLLTETIAALKDNEQFGYDAVLHIPDITSHTGKELAGRITEERATLAVVHPNLVKDPRALALLYRLLPLGVNVTNFWDFYELLFDKVALKELSEEWFVENVYTHRPLYDKSTRVLELVLGTLLFLVLLPLTILIAILIRLTSRGPAIYSQTRMGKNGASFVLYKFRTMRHKSRGALWTESGDTRVTPFGRLLRFTHLDEIPQLVNIVKGDISIAGPRPERVELAAKYASLPHYDIRHVIKPGLTGWAQIKFRPSASLEEAHEKLCYDMYYIKYRSLFLDLIIILKTIRYFLTSRPQ